MIKSFPRSILDKKEVGSTERLKRIKLMTMKLIQIKSAGITLFLVVASELQDNE